MGKICLVRPSEWLKHSFQMYFYRLYNVMMINKGVQREAKQKMIFWLFQPIMKLDFLLLPLMIFISDLESISKARSFSMITCRRFYCLPVSWWTHKIIAPLFSPSLPWSDNINQSSAQSKESFFSSLRCTDIKKKNKCFRVNNEEKAQNLLWKMFRFLMRLCWSFQQSFNCVCGGMKCTFIEWIRFNLTRSWWKLVSWVEISLFCLLENSTNTALIHSRKSTGSSVKLEAVLSVTTQKSSSSLFVLHDCFTKQDRHCYSLERKNIKKEFKTV